MINFAVTDNVDASGNVISTNNGTITDPNGNQIGSITYIQNSGTPNVSIGETDWIDTLGQPVLKITSQANGPNGLISEADYNRLAVDGSYQTVAVKYQFVTVQSNFGCSGVTEFTASNIRLVSEIDLPNGQKYVFSYEPTPGVAGSVTGRLQQVTLPTGGTITYQYPGPNGGLDCTTGASLQLTRIISDGGTSAIWGYVRALNNKGGTTTVTAPQMPYDQASNQTVITFDPLLGVETSRKIYQGASAGTPIRTINTSWTNNNSSFNNTPTGQTVILEDGSTQSQVETTYDTNGLLQVRKEHDWGAGAPGAVLRTTSLYYLTAYSSLNIINKVNKQTIADASGAIKSRTDITYDDPGFINVNCISGAPQRNTNYDCPYATRGLATSVTTYTDAATPSGGVTKNYSYDSVGNLISAQLNCCQQKQWTFSAATQYAFPDSVTSGGAGTQLTTSTTYNLTTGQVKTATDENGQVTTFTYADAGHLDRLTDVERPDHAHNTRSYNDIADIVTDTAPLQGTNVVQTVTALDGLGRPTTTTTEDATNKVYSISATQYDPVGRAYKTSNPYVTSPQFWTTSQFDTIGRPTVATLPDGAQMTSSYSANFVTLTDAALNQRKSFRDGLGRLTEVDEPGGGSSPTPSSGSLTIGGTLQSWAGSAQSATSGHVELTFSGTLKSNTSCSPSGQPCTDSGSISITVAGSKKSVAYSSSTGNDSGQAVQAIASAFHLDSTSPVDAVYYGADESGNYVMDLIARAKGAASNYPLLVSITSNNPTNFSPPSFQVSAGSSLIDGQDASSGGTIYDSGVVYLTVGTFTASAPYSHTGNNTAAMIASALVAAGPASLNQSASPVTATANGSTITLNYKTAGAATNVFVNVDSSTANPDNPSFSSPGVTLSGGADAVPASLSTPAVTLYSYGALDNLLKVAEGVQTRSYGYDDMGRATDVTTPEAGHVGYQYNSFDLVAQRTDARGVITSYTYDGLNRLKTLSYNVGNTGVPPTPSVTYQYGANSALNNNGRLLSVSDGIGSETYSYDQLGRVINVQKVINGTFYNIGYAYNLAGELTQLTYPSGRIVQQSFDGIGRLCEIAPQTTGCATAAGPYATAYAYNTASQMTGFNYGNGVNASFSYSPDRMQLTGLSYMKGTQTLFGLNYFYQQDSTNCPGGAAGNNGQIQCVVDNVDSGRNTSYGYDPLARLTSAVTKGSTNYPAWGLAFAYDRYGNRTAQTVTEGSGFPVATSVDATTNRINIGSYTYDANGNMTDDGNNVVAFDAANRPVNSAQNGATSTYGYDCKSLRVIKSSGGVTTVYLFSGIKVIAEYQNGASSNAPSREYIYSGAGLLAKIEGGATNYYHADRLLTRATTDTNGNVVGQQGLYPFGDPWYDSGSTSKKKLGDYERDSESGNDYALARSYVNRIGRFLSSDQDPGGLVNPQTLNRYSYLANDPVNGTDPLGMFVLAIDRFLDPAGFGSNGYFGDSLNEFWLLEGDIGPEGYNGFSGGWLLLGDATKINAARAKVMNILNGNNPCAQFFNNNALAAVAEAFGLPPATGADVLASANVVEDSTGPSQITRSTDQNGNYSYAQPYAAKTTQNAGFDATIHLNPNGAFFNDKANVRGTGEFGQLSIGGTQEPYQYTGDSIGAQMAILLHELAHDLGLIPSDGTDPQQSLKNTQTILNHCQNAINAAKGK